MYQGGRYPKKKDRGSIFFEVTFGLGLTRYVSRRLSIYGNGLSIFENVFECARRYGILDVLRGSPNNESTFTTIDVSFLSVHMPHRSNSFPPPHPYTQCIEDDTKSFELVSA